MRLPACLALLALLQPAGIRAEPFCFVAFGDMPYCDPRDAAGCRAEIGRVEALVTTINAARPAFSIFLGDTKGGSESCADPIVLDRTQAWFGQVEGALVYTPGDNEWTDCWQARSGGFDPLERLRSIRETFFAAPRSLGRAPIPLLRQGDSGPEHRPFVENARWERDGVLFVTAHVVGSDNNRPQGPGGDVPPGAAREFPARDRANLAWIAESFAAAGRGGHRAVVIGLQADLYFRDRCGRGTVEGHLATRRALAEGARRFARPVLLLHGDSHFFLLDQPVPEAPNLTRLMVPGAEDVRAVLVTVDPAAAAPFRAEPIGTADRVRAPGCG